jgi:AcrR family transcriptional regulator
MTAVFLQLRMADVKTARARPNSRRARAQQTRLRLIDAAHQLFVERGYTGTRMADVAETAGVAVQTVYFRFHTKAELLQACYESAVLGPESIPPPRQPWYQALLNARSGDVALRHFAEGSTAIVARVGVLDDVVRSAMHEPDAVAVRAHNEQLRRDGYRDICAHISKKFGLRRPLTVTTATDLLLAFGGTSLYRGLVLDCGWPRSEYVDWLARTLSQQLLPAAA